MLAFQARKLLLLGALFSVACVSSELTASAGHPADPHAAGAPVPGSSTLAPGFEPFQAYGVQGTQLADEHHAHARHAEQADAEHAHHGQHAAPDAGSSAEPDGGVVYVCPMHPEVRRATPGRCPICGMKLVPRRKDGAR